MPGQKPYTLEEAATRDNLFRDAMDAEELFDLDELERHAAKELAAKIAVLPRERCVEILTSVSIQCYDSEPTEVLREAIASNIDDGTLSRSSVEGVA